MTLQPYASAKIFIVHGYMASVDSHWFPWLQEKLSALGASAKIVQLPQPNHPDAEEWAAALREQIGRVDANTYIVAHSLGCISSLLYLQQHPDRVQSQLGGAILVSGFAESLAALPELNPFMHAPLNDERLVSAIRERAVIAARNDEIVPVEASRQLAQRLDAELHELERGGHFLDSDGFTEFPLALELVIKMIGRA